MPGRKTVWGWCFCSWSLISSSKRLQARMLRVHMSCWTQKRIRALWNRWCAPEAFSNDCWGNTNLPTQVSDIECRKERGRKRVSAGRVYERSQFSPNDVTDVERWALGVNSEQGAVTLKKLRKRFLNEQTSKSTIVCFERLSLSSDTCGVRQRITWPNQRMRYWISLSPSIDEWILSANRKSIVESAQNNRSSRARSCCRKTCLYFRSYTSGLLFLDHRARIVL